MIRSIACLLVLGAALLFSGAAALADLSGQKGKMRAMGQYPSEGCGELFDRYVAASGHSAYATTVVSQYSAAICGIALNKRSVEAAEKAAIASCEQGNRKWSIEQVGKCFVGASK